MSNKKKNISVKIWLLRVLIVAFPIVEMGIIAFLASRIGFRTTLALIIASTLIGFLSMLPSVRKKFCSWFEEFINNLPQSKKDKIREVFDA